ncbi:MAG: hypothetical protein M1825_000246 [Sarcosagium campestre]|nr:MAG: hypothetical protein M1825_000246 [Sarcosagium campestre]
MAANERADQPQTNGRVDNVPGPGGWSGAQTQPNGNEKSKVAPTSGPAGGFDDTQVPYATPGYTVRFTFHRATSLPMADINTFSSDPYVLAQLNVNLPTRHKEDPFLRFRTPTIRRNTDPVWDASWVVANVPKSGFKLKARIYDEDSADHDDRLGNVHVIAVDIDESWAGIHERPYKIKIRMGSKRAYLIRAIAVTLSHGLNLRGDLVISAEVLGRTEGEGGKVYTVGPQHWSKHFSPLIGRITGTKAPGSRSPGEKPGVERYNFQANQFQLQGPVPNHLYHRYVEFKPFIKGMFSKAGLRGRILNHALHHQHARVYNYDRSTIYGSFPAPCEEMTKQFLDMVHHDQGARIFTYVLSLDGLFCFTETGKEFGIDMLSKHTMHSDVSIYIAYSGEFFIRRLKHKDRSSRSPTQATHPPDVIEGGPPESDPPEDPAHYELIIDNDSGTYRPNAKYLPKLQDYLRGNFPGLRVRALANDDESLERMKSEQKERKKQEGGGRTFVQGSSSSSISSSDESDLEEREERAAYEERLRKRKGKKGTGGLSAAVRPAVLKDRIRELPDAKGVVKKWASTDQADGKAKPTVGAPG